MDKDGFAAFEKSELSWLVFLSRKEFLSTNAIFVKHLLQCNRRELIAIQQAVSRTPFIDASGSENSDFSFRRFAKLVFLKRRKKSVVITQVSTRENSIPLTTPNYIWSGASIEIITKYPENRCCSPNLCILEK